MLSDELDSKPEVDLCFYFCFSHSGCSLKSGFCSGSPPAAAGAVCPERLHPAGAESGGVGVQTLLPSSSGSGWELPLRSSGAHRSASYHLRISLNIQLKNIKKSNQTECWCWRNQSFCFRIWVISTGRTKQHRNLHTRILCSGESWYKRSSQFLASPLKSQQTQNPKFGTF